MKNIAFAISGILLTGAVALVTLPSQGYSATNNESSGTSSGTTNMNCPSGQHYDSATGKCSTSSTNY